MTKFIQIHYLTSYPASNLNRDDLGRPKTVNYGGKNRIRISSQCLKRTWRTSDEFINYVGNNGKRTRQICIDIYNEKIKDYPSQSTELMNNLNELKMYLTNEKVKAKKQISLENLQLSQLVYLNEAEIDFFKKTIDSSLINKTKPDLIKFTTSSQLISNADVSLFGRMFASNPSLDIEAAVQVSHAFTVHESQIESDYFTAIDDIVSANKGSAHIGEKEFGSGLFYGYLCINYDLLLKNLTFNAELAKKSIEGLINAVAKVAPSGSQNSYGANSQANFVLLELGNNQPRSFAHAFLKPIWKDYESQAIQQIHDLKNKLELIYPENKNQDWETSLENPVSLKFNIEQLLNNI